MDKELLEQLADPDPKVRRDAARQLRSSSEPGTREGLLSALVDSDEFVRRNAALGLASWDATEVTDALLSLLSDPGFEVRCTAIRVLGNRPSVGDKIIGALRQRFWELDGKRRGNRKRGAATREWDLLLRTLQKIDVGFEEWRTRQRALELSGEPSIVPEKVRNRSERRPAAQGSIDEPEKHEIQARRLKRGLSLALAGFAGLLVSAALIAFPIVGIPALLGSLYMLVYGLFYASGQAGVPLLGPNVTYTCPHCGGKYCTQGPRGAFTCPFCRKTWQLQSSQGGHPGGS